MLNPQTYLLFTFGLLLLLLSRFSRVRLCATPQTAAYQAPYPWDSPGKNTGVGCHFLLQCMKMKSESEVAQSCPTLQDPMDCTLPGSSAHGIFQARVLEWKTMSSCNAFLCNSENSLRWYAFSSPTKIGLTSLLCEMQFYPYRKLLHKYDTCGLKHNI